MFSAFSSVLVRKGRSCALMGALVQGSIRTHLQCTISLKFPQRLLPLKQFQCSSPLSSSERSRRALPLFTPLSPPGNRWCDVLGFAAGSVSSSSTLHIFQATSHMCGVLTGSLSARSVPRLQHARNCISGRL